MKAIIKIEWDGESQDSYGGVLYEFNNTNGKCMSGNPCVDLIDTYKIFHQNKITEIEEHESVLYFDFGGNEWSGITFDGVTYFVPHTLDWEKYLNTLSKIMTYYKKEKEKSLKNPWSKFV